MKIAIASKRQDEDSEVSERSGRAPYYMIYEKGKLIKTIKNPFAIGGGGAGFGVAKMLNDEDVDIVVAGRFGDNMRFSLEEKNIKYIEIQNRKVKKALEEIKE